MSNRKASYAKSSHEMVEGQACYRKHTLEHSSQYLIKARWLASGFLNQSQLNPRYSSNPPALPNPWFNTPSYKVIKNPILTHVGHASVQ